MDKELREKIIEAIDLLFKKHNYAYSQQDVDICIAQILACIKEAGYVKLADDQSFPDYPKQDMGGHYIQSAHRNMVQQEMRRAGWRKVEVKDGQD